MDVKKPSVNLPDPPPPDNQSPVRPSKVGPPIDDHVCGTAPPASGNWKLLAVDGVIEQPWVWLQV